MMYYPPNRPNIIEDRSIFLAGTIEQGKSEDWQDAYATFLQYQGFQVFNPRRKDWDSSWVENIQNLYFKEQVEWELDYLIKTKFCVFRFLENTVSPVSLMELGYRGAIWNETTYVVCDEKYFKKGNIDVFCKKLNIKQFNEKEFFKFIIKEEYKCHIE